MNNIEKLNHLLMRVLKLAYLNFLWIMGTVVGLGILGIGPSTAAVFSIIREWLRGNEDLPVMKSFIEYYRQYFKQSNLISLFYLAVGFILTLDYIYASRWEWRVMFGLLIFLYLISATFIYPVFVHYDLKSFKEMIRYSFLIGFSYLQYTLVLFVGMAVIYVVTARIYPALVTFFGISFLIFCIMKMAFVVFGRIEESAKETQTSKH